MATQVIDLERLSLDDLVTEYQAVIDELVALDCVPVRPDNDEHQQRLERLYIRAGECSMEINRRARYQPQAVTLVEDDETEGETP